MDVFSALTTCSVLSMHFALEEMYTQKGNWSRCAVFPAKPAALMRIATLLPCLFWASEILFHRIFRFIICDIPFIYRNIFRIKLADQGSSTYHNYWTIMQALSRLSTDIPYQTFVSKPDFYTNSRFYRGSRVTSDCELRALQVEPRGVSSRVPVTCAVNKLIRSNFL